MVVIGLKYLYKILNKCEIWFVFTIATLDQSTVPESSNPAGMYMYVYILKCCHPTVQIHKCDVVLFSTTIGDNDQVPPPPPPTLSVTNNGT